MIPFNKPYLTGKETHYIYEAIPKKLQIIFSQKYSFLYILVINTIFFALASWLLPIRFEENDDVVMLLFASGKYTGTPEHNLVFINVVWGYLVSFLYSISSKVEWYTVLFSLLHILSLSIIIWSIYIRKVNLVVKALFIILFLVLEVRLILLFQFTTTAAISALGGLVLLLQDKSCQHKCGVVLLVLSSLIRIEASLLTIIVMSPLLISFVLKNNKIILNKSVVHIFIAIGCIFLFSFIDKMNYNKDQDWKYYQTYNHLRGQINDNPNSGQLLSNLPSGIKLQDYQLLLNSFSDPGILNLQKVELLCKSILNVSIEKKISNIYPSLRSYTLILLLVTILWLIVFLNTAIRKNKIYLLISFFIFYFVLCYVSLNGTLKYRVFLTALMPFVLLLFYTIEQLNKRIFYFFIVVVIGSFVLLFSNRTAKIREQKYNWQHTEFLEQKILLQTYFANSKKSVVPLAADLNIEFYQPYNISNSFQPNQMIFLGWVTSIPYNRNKLNSHLYLVKKCAVFTNKKNLGGPIALIIESVKMNYNINVISKQIVASKNYVIVEFFEMSKNTNP